MVTGRNGGRGLGRILGGRDPRDGGGQGQAHVRGRHGGRRGRRLVGGGSGRGLTGCRRSIRRSHPAVVIADAVTFDLDGLVPPGDRVVVRGGEVGVVGATVVVGPYDDGPRDLSGGHARLVDQVGRALGEAFGPQAPLYANHASSTSQPTENEPHTSQPTENEPHTSQPTEMNPT